MDQRSIALDAEQRLVAVNSFYSNTRRSKALPELTHSKGQHRLHGTSSKSTAFISINGHLMGAAQLSNTPGT